LGVDRFDLLADVVGVNRRERGRELLVLADDRITEREDI